MVQKLQDLAQTTYSRWFNQFEFPNEEGKPYKSSGGKLIYNEKLKKEIPIDWAVDKLQKIAESKLGGTPNRSNIKYWNNGDIFWINSGEVNNFPIIDTEEKITQEGLINSATKLLPKKSIVISITGNIRFSIIGINCSTNQSVIGIIENKIFKTPYLYFALKDFQNIFESKMVGAVQKHINKEIIDTTEILIPPINILERYYKITENIFNQIFEISFKTKELLNLKNQLLPLLINGQLI